jgi:hypothetical protein
LKFGPKETTFFGGKVATLVALRKFVLGASAGGAGIASVPTLLTTTLRARLAVVDSITSKTRLKAIRLVKGYVGNLPAPDDF